jgi:hypothetical protein
MRTFWPGVVSIAALFLATVVSGQQLATLNISVTDQSGGAIPKAQITTLFKAPKPARKGMTQRMGMVSLPFRDYLPATTSYWSARLSLVNIKPVSLLRSGRSGRFQWFSAWARGENRSKFARPPGESTRRNPM